MNEPATPGLVGSSEGLGLRPERSDVLAQLRLRILREHGGLGDGWRDHWNLTPGDSLMHREAVAEIERLRAVVKAARSNEVLGGMVEKGRTMARKRFRWTRKTYKHADWLARFMGRHLYELHNQPNLLRRYFELWERHPQKDDPLLQPLSWRYSRDDIPF